MTEGDIRKKTLNKANKSLMRLKAPNVSKISGYSRDLCRNIQIGICNHILAVIET